MTVWRPARHQPVPRQRAGCCGMVLPVYVINLERRSDRMAHMAAHLNELGLRFERIEATDVSSLPNDGSVNRPPFLDTGSSACLMSHRRALLAFLDSHHAGALILEDDVRLASDVPLLCESIEWWPPGACVLEARCPGPAGAAAGLALRPDAERPGPPRDHPLERGSRSDPPEPRGRDRPEPGLWQIGDTRRSCDVRHALVAPGRGTCGPSKSFPPL